MKKDTLLLLHGALGSAEQLTGLSAALEGAFQVFTPEFSSHGKTPPGSAFGIPTFAEDLLRFLEQHSLERVNIFGYSMGGYVALYLAHIRPEKVNAIFTLGTKIHWTEQYARHETGRLDPEKIALKVPAFAAELEKRHSAAGWETLLKDTARMMTELGRENLLTPQVLQSLELPACIGQGDRDNTLTLEEGVSTYRLLQKGQLMIFPDTQHPLEKTNTNLLASALKAFLA